jgi:hypothetical protein
MNEENTRRGSTKKNAVNSGTCSLRTKTNMRMLFAVIYLQMEALFYIEVEKLFGMKHFAVSAIYISS